MYVAIYVHNIIVATGTTWPGIGVDKCVTTYSVLPPELIYQAL